MAFYSIIFGVLFLAACRQAFLLAGTDTFWAAAAVAILVFNDALNTSHVMERKDAPPYRMWMKIMDLVSFMILSAALVALNPTDNPFGVVPSVLWQDRLRGWTAWPFMTAYWVLTIGWNWLAGVYRRNSWPRWLKVVSHLLLLLPLAVTIWVAAVGPAPRWLQIAVLSGFSIYFLVLKPLNEKEHSVSAA